MSSNKRKRIKITRQKNGIENMEFSETSLKEDEEKEKRIGNIQMKRFHRNNCRWAEKIPKEKRCIFRTRQEALKNGFKPCRVCKA